MATTAAAAAGATTTFLNLTALANGNFSDPGWLDICVVNSTRGYIAPIGGDAERMWNPYVLGVLYFLGLGWCFLGVSIIADIFMNAIEKITSIDRILTQPDGSKLRVRTWNDTVANLTLMAMGSSAPEIMVNVIEITGQGFYSGDLGPSTVVGSAAFNLLVISAFCTFAITKGEVRRVKEIGVYAATSTTSIFAYVWLVVILVAITPDVVEFWEAAVTFAGFPALVIGAYLIETKRCNCCCAKARVRVAASSLDNGDIGIIKAIASNAELHADSDVEAQRRAIASVLRQVREQNSSVPSRVAMQLAIQEIAKRHTPGHHSRAFHRVAASRARSGHKLPAVNVGDAVSQLMAQLEADALTTDVESPKGGGSNRRSRSRSLDVEAQERRYFHFSDHDYSVLESTQKVQVVLMRPPREQGDVVRIVSREGTAKEGEDFVPIDAVVAFAPGQNSATFVVDIVEDNIYEDDEYFYLDLMPVRPDSPTAKTARHNLEELLAAAAAEVAAGGSPEPIKSASSSTRSFSPVPAASPADRLTDVHDSEGGSGSGSGSATAGLQQKRQEEQQPQQQHHHHHQDSGPRSLDRQLSLRTPQSGRERSTSPDHQRPMSPSKVLPSARKGSGDSSDASGEFPSGAFLAISVGSPKASPRSGAATATTAPVVDDAGDAVEMVALGEGAAAAGGTAASDGAEGEDGGGSATTPPNSKRGRSQKVTEMSVVDVGNGGRSPTPGAGATTQTAAARADTERAVPQAAKEEPLLPLRGGRRLDTAIIHIIDDSAPGVLNFSVEHYTALESENKVTITVKRQHGGKGTVSVKVKTEDREAVSPDDYVGIDEDEPMVLEFAPGELEKSFDIEIVDDKVYEKDESFDVVLFDAEGGASLVDTTYDSDEVKANVVIVSDEKERAVVHKMAQFFAINYGKVRIGRERYSQQFVDAVFPGGDRECKASPGVWFLHILAFPWRILFALIPPVDLWNGWATFFLALLGIAGATMIMTDLAGLLGCVLGLPPAFTAITLVALGTSVPDLFASMNAARADQYADASIGNVMGSNSVNVFMGLGLPWLLAAVYWNYFSAGEDLVIWAHRYRDLDNPGVQEIIAEALRGDRPHGVFIVPAADLGFSVGVFCAVALLCLLIFGLRRHYAGGELGGATVSKCVSGWFMLFLWAMYILISGLYIFGVFTIDL